MKRRIYTFLLLGLMLGSVITNAQNALSIKADLVYASAQNAERSQAFPEVAASISKFRIYELNAQAIYKHVSASAAVKEFTIDFEKEKWEFTTWLTDMRSSNYVLRALTEDGIREFPMSAPSHYKGYVNGNTENRLRFAIRDGHMEGVVNIDGVEYALQPLSVFDESYASAGHFVVYKMMDKKPLGDASCGFQAIAGPGNIMDAKAAYSHKTAGNAPVCVELADVCDYNFFSKAGGTVAAAEKRLMDILNLVQGNYDQHEIGWKVVEVFVEATDAKTWGTSYDFGTIIQQTLPPWANSNLKNPRDLVSIYFGRSMSYGGNSGVIGLAWQPGLCVNNQGYSVLEYYAPWGDDLTRHKTNQTHELGHNWNCQHSTTGTIMDPSLGGLETGWSSASTSTINSYKSGNAQNCVDNSACVYDDPPAAGFTSDKTQGCNSITVQFTDETTNNPTTWLWDFGDGQTSSQQNPTHTYNDPGTYTVTLKASNQHGDNTVTKTALINVGAGNLYPVQKVGPVDNTFGEGGYFSANNVRRLYFDALDDVTIKSVKVYADMAGDRIIEILDATEQRVAAVNVNIPTGESRVELDVYVPQGNNYAIRVASTLVNLFRNSIGPSYPYTIDGLVSITKTDAASSPTAATDYYYYFYDWEVRKAGCEGPSTGIESERINEMLVYPNPVREVLNIELPGGIPEGVHIKVYNLLGETVYEKDFGTVAGRFEHQVSLNTLPSGNYLLFIKAGDKVISKKIMKELI